MHIYIFFQTIFRLLDEIKKYNFNIQSIDDIEQLSALCQKYSNYLYYSDIDGRDYIITHEGIPSQFLRMLLAKTQGIETCVFASNILKNCDGIPSCVII